MSEFDTGTAGNILPWVLHKTIESGGVSAPPQKELRGWARPNGWKSGMKFENRFSCKLQNILTRTNYTISQTSLRLPESIYRIITGIPHKIPVVQPVDLIHYSHARNGRRHISILSHGQPRLYLVADFKKLRQYLAEIRKTVPYLICTLNLSSTGNPECDVRNRKIYWQAQWRQHTRRHEHSRYFCQM